MNADAAARHSSGLLAILSVAPPYLWKGASHAPLANRAYWTSQKSISSAHRPCERIEKAGWGVLVTREKKMQFPANRDGRPSPHRGRVVRPDALGGKACWAYTSTVPVERSGIRAAHRGLDAPVRRHRCFRLTFILLGSEIISEVLKCKHFRSTWQFENKQLRKRASET